ncbi:peroxidase family protein [Litoribrevibacter albus]|uniref:Peroxidase n=1 Tax=Litoribrevibacter albus TaxID=1473156 RepID=A0AA37SB01_9GAMM|nr:peroxidase family protein [Litoribrevibacter albus]GLQ31369.1 hypothetical protein GCM10007876_18480 [Litoribrevibacter albus]
MNSVWVTWPSLVKFGTLGVAAAALTLSLERTELLKNNMFATEDLDQINDQIVCDERSQTARTEDGTCNILENPAEGSVHRRFGRNVELEAAWGETEADTLLTPNPREVSNSLMARDDFKPATSINFIAAAWIQFMVHDWVSHGPNTSDDPILVNLPDNDPLGNGVLSIERTTPDSNRSAEDDAYLPPTYRNVNTHWWDGSQLYGSNKETSDKVRSFVDGKLKVESDGSLPTDFWSGVPITGFNDNWWLGLSMMHQLFTLEHNAIADTFKQSYPNATDQWLYDKARLVNSALMAKIHTVEWTPALLQNPVLELSMESNWWGITRNAETRDLIQKVTDDLKGPNSWIINTIALFDPEKAEALSTPGAVDHALGGLVGQSKPNNYGVPYTLTEEFVAVYRMHPLLRDEVDVYDIGSNIVSNRIPLQDTRDGDAEDILEDEGGDRLWYSFGITHPGALTLNNYPEFLRNLSMPLIGDIDLATMDIVRDRERGVPRYNEFRRQIGLTPITQFEDLTTDPTTLAELKRIYNNDIEQIDALVGQLAETIRPDGFAFGETAFQIFILNASRRLMTDRFYTESYTPEVYTQEGIDWVEGNTMVDVLKRHFPNLSLSLTGVDNAFKPWDLKIPEDYKSWAACDKESLLWTNGALRTEYDQGERPDLTPVDIGGLIDSILWEKVNRKDDVAPLGYEKPIHAHGAMATVEFEATTNHPYTGVFKGADCGLLRLSVTGDPNDRGFAPGLAWKVFVDGKNSRNVSALYTLSGQGDNHNFFANELSNYVDKEVNETLGTTALFSLVSTKPTTLAVSKMAKVQADGTQESSVTSPTQIYFAPRPEVQGLFNDASHDFRDDLQSLPEGTPIYDVYATSQAIKTSIIPYFHNKYATERRNSAVKVGTIKTTSKFNSSAFGDGGVFFRHQRVEDQ